MIERMVEKIARLSERRDLVLCGRVYTTKKGGNKMKKNTLTRLPRRKLTEICTGDENLYLYES